MTEDDDRTKRLAELDAHDAPTITPSAARRTSSARTFETDQIVAGRYRIVRFIARGGMGEVYEAEDLELHGSVALKTILPEIADDAVSVERFRREIQIARRITHPNICRVFDVSHDQRGDDSSGADVMFVTMELLTGQTLRQRIVESGPLSTQDALPIARQIAEGLQAAHRAGVVHRDLKSANVMIVPDPGHDEPRVVITDFGLARASVFGEQTVTSSGDVIGSPAYMAPEQIEGAPVSAATDIYAFGIVLYEMITRSHPFEAETPLASLVKRLREPALSPRTHVPDLDPAWEQALLHCLERDPADRFPDARSVVRALEGEPTRTVPSLRRARMRRVAIVLAAIVVIVGAAALVKWIRDHRVPAPAKPPAATHRPAVAVIGFRNQSGEADVSWLSTALTEMLTTEVAAAEQVRAIPGNTVSEAKLELGLGDVIPAPALPRLRTVLGADYVVSGSYTGIGAPGTRQLRLDIQLQEALGGNVLATFAETGTEGGIFDLVSRAGSRLRQKLGVPSVTPEAASGILASLPANPRAVRYYAEGLASVRAYDDLKARQLLEKAIAEDPNFPLAHSALGAVYHSLGYDARAKAEAQAAMQHAAGLPRESRLLIEAQSHAEHERYLQAAEIYLALWRFYPDNLDYAVRAALARIYGGKGKEALTLLESLKSASPEPRIDLAESEAAESTSDYKRAIAAALRAVKNADARGQRLLAARARLSEGWARLRMSDRPGARAAFEDAKRRYEQAGNQAATGQALGGIGAVLYDAGQLDEALAVFEAELKIAQSTGSRERQGADLQNIAMVHYKKGDLAKARTVLQRALAIDEERGDPARVAGMVGMIAGVESDAGNLAEATGLYERALALNEQVGAAHAAANNRNNLAVIRKTKGDLEGAQKLFEQAMAGFRQTHDDAAVADVLNNLASIQQSRGDLAGAERSYKEAEQVYTRLQSKSDLALVAVNVSSILRDRGDLAGAKQKAAQALSIWRSTDEKSYAAYALMALADVETRRGDLAAAETLLRDALRERREMGEASTAAESLLALADVAFEQGRIADSESMAREALATFEKEERSDVMAVAKTILCRIALMRHDLPAASRLLREGDALATSSGEASAQFAVALMDARLATASAKPTVAITQLTALIDRSTRQGNVPQQFEARLALAEATLAAAHPAAAHSQLDTLAWDATKKGFGLIARKALRFK